MKYPEVGRVGEACAELRADHVLFHSPRLGETPRPTSFRLYPAPGRANRPGEPRRLNLKMNGRNVRTTRACPRELRFIHFPLRAHDSAGMTDVARKAKTEGTRPAIIKDWPLRIFTDTFAELFASP